MVPSEMLHSETYHPDIINPSIFPLEIVSKIQTNLPYSDRTNLSATCKLYHTNSYNCKYEIAKNSSDKTKHLILACGLDDLETVNVLIEHFFEEISQDILSDPSFLYLLISKSCREIFLLLITNFDVNLKIPDYYVRTALDTNASATIDLISSIAKSCYHNIENIKNCHILKAIKLDRDDILSVIISQNAQLKIQAVFSVTLTDCIKHNSVKVLELMLKNGCMINWKPENSVLELISDLDAKCKYDVAMLFIKYHHMSYASICKLLSLNRPSLNKIIYDVNY